MNRLENLLAILAKPAQRLENAMIQLLTQRTSETAIGAQLDVLGRIVGQDRGGLTDDVFRRYIQARIATNRATGKREELIRIAKLVVNDETATIYIDRQPPAALLLRVDGVAVDPSIEAVLLTFMKLAVALGVRILVQSNSGAPANVFKFSDGSLSPGPGFDNTASPGSGGAISDVRV